MTILENLEETKKLLSDPGRWCQGAAALNSEGRFVSPIEKYAVSWCLIGALRKTAHLCGLGEVVTETTDFIRKEVLYRFISGFNDDPRTSHADVLNLLDRAIEKAKNVN